MTEKGGFKIMKVFRKLGSNADVDNVENDEADEPNTSGVSTRYLDSRHVESELPTDDAHLYNLVASASVELSEASCSNGIFSVVRSIRDIDNAKRRKFLYNIPLPKNGITSTVSIPPTELSDSIQCRVTSPSGTKIAILLSEGKDDTLKQVIEIWSDAQTLTNRIVLPKKLHGKVVNDAKWFGQLSWHPDETCLVYSAERSIPKTTSFFAKEEDNGESSCIRGGTSVLGLGKQETWGEKYSDQSALLDLFLVDIETGRVGRVMNVPGNSGKENTTEGGYTLGQACFSPCGTHVVYTAWDAGGGSDMPRRLGMIYCFQRPSKLYASSVKKLQEYLAKDEENDSPAPAEEGPVCLTQGARLSRSPRFSSTKSGTSKLVYLSNKLGFDTHDGGMAIHVLEWNVDKAKCDLDSQRVWVETVLRPPPRSGDEEADIQVGNMSFPGIYTSQFPISCCTDDFLLLTTQWGSVQRVVRLDLSDGNLTLLSVDIVRDSGVSTEPSASQSLLCVTSDGGSLIAESAPNRPTVVGYVPKSALASEKVYVKVDATPVIEMGPMAASSICRVPRHIVSEALDFGYEVLAMRPPQIEDQVDTPVQWILMDPRPRPDGAKPPLIVVPHGGPHSCTPTTFAPSYAFLCASGYAILHVNYRGSVGFGQESMDALPGNVGLLDVKDVIHAAITISDSGWVDPDRMAICGGSHGGFLAAHCIGQFPDLFKAAALRNPVTNIASMVTATDIPDWCYVEALGCGSYNGREYRGAMQEELHLMWEASPAKHASQVIVPTLVALGMADKRVPPSQGLEYYHTLRAQGLETKLLMYDKDDHAIDNVASEADHWINIKQWFDEHV